jgi:hypothetical protein
MQAFFRSLCNPLSAEFLKRAVPAWVRASIHLFYPPHLPARLCRYRHRTSVCPVLPRARDSFPQKASGSGLRGLFPPVTLAKKGARPGARAYPGGKKVLKRKENRRGSEDFRGIEEKIPETFGSLRGLIKKS